MTQDAYPAATAGERREPEEHTERAQPAASAPPPAATGAPASGRGARRRPSTWLVLGIVAGGLALGGVGARLTASLRPPPTPVITILPGPGAVGPGGLPLPGGAPGALPDGGAALPPPPLPGGSMPMPSTFPGGAFPVAPPGLAGGPVGAPPTGPAGPVPPPGGSVPAATAPALVTAVDGDTITLMTAAGPQRVRLTDRTRLQKQAPAERDEIAPGRLLVVRGEPDGDELVAGTIELLGGPLPPGGSAREPDPGGPPTAQAP